MVAIPPMGRQMTLLRMPLAAAVVIRLMAHQDREVHTVTPKIVRLLGGSRHRRPQGKLLVAMTGMVLEETNTALLDTMTKATNLVIPVVTVGTTLMAENLRSSMVPTPLLVGMGTTAPAGLVVRV